MSWQYLSRPWPPRWQAIRKQFCFYFDISDLFQIGTCYSLSPVIVCLWQSFKSNWKWVFYLKIPLPFIILLVTVIFEKKKTIEVVTGSAKVDRARQAVIRQGQFYRRDKSSHSKGTFLILIGSKFLCFHICPRLSLLKNIAYINKWNQFWKTVKDVKRMQLAEAGGKGLLKARGYTPKVDSPLAARPGSLKRKR